MKLLNIFVFVSFFAYSFTSFADYKEVDQCGSMEIVSGSSCKDIKIHFSFEGCRLKEKPMMAKSIQCEENEGIVRLGYKGHRYQGKLKLGENSWGEPKWVAGGKLKQWVRKSILEAEKNTPKKTRSYASYAPQSSGKPSLQIYGDFRYAIGQFSTTSAANVETDTVQAVNNASRLGFKGAMGDGAWKIIYNYQLGAVNDGVTGQTSGTTSRFFWAGIKNKDYGFLKYGLLSTPYKMAGLRLDPFYDTSAGTGNAVANFGQSSLTNGFTSNSLVYTSPTYWGVTAEAATFLADTASNSADYNFGLSYKKSGFDVGAYYAVVNSGAAISQSTAGDKALQLYGKYSQKKWSFAVSSESFDAASNNDSKFLYINGTFNVLEATRLAASYGAVSDTGSTATDGTGFTLAVFQKIIEKTEAHLLFSSTEFDDNSDDSRVVVGISHKFGWNL